MTQLEIIHYIHEYRTPLIDTFFKGLNYLDTYAFILIFVPAIWYGTNWRIGIKLFYIILISRIVNDSLKDLFQELRPYEVDPTAGLIRVDGYSFPSGAAQTAALLCSLLIYYGKHSWKWIVAGLYFFLLSFSRVYLGVHYPTDVLGGWAVGFLLFCLYISIEPPFEKWLKRQHLLTALIVGLAVPALFLLWRFTPSIIRGSAFAMGLTLGISLNSLMGWGLPDTQRVITALSRAVIAVLAFSLFLYAFALVLPHSMTMLFVKAVLSGLWMATGCLWLCRWLLPQEKSTFH